MKKKKRRRRRILSNNIFFNFTSLENQQKANVFQKFAKSQ